MEIFIFSSAALILLYMTVKTTVYCVKTKENLCSALKLWSRPARGFADFFWMLYEALLFLFSFFVKDVVTLSTVWSFVCLMSQYGITMLRNYGYSKQNRFRLYGFLPLDILYLMFCAGLRADPSVFSVALSVLCADAFFIVLDLVDEISYFVICIIDFKKKDGKNMCFCAENNIFSHNFGKLCGKSWDICTKTQAEYKSQCVSVT